MRCAGKDKGHGKFRHAAPVAARNETFFRAYWGKTVEKPNEKPRKTGSA